MLYVVSPLDGVNGVRRNLLAHIGSPVFVRHPVGQAIAIIVRADTRISLIGYRRMKVRRRRTESR
jgi:hypothetical protein